ncbi:MAG TPA: putative sulfate exporter family transporter [Phycisphaerales bacterium]|nr:putative sulfate exporter family transporter [Phycisphaerales bacterium]
MNRQDDSEQLPSHQHNADVDLLAREHDAPPMWGASIGWILSIFVAAAAYGVEYLPFPPFQVVEPTGAVRAPLSAAIIAILLGAIIRNVAKLPSSVSFGCRAIVRYVIPLAIVLVGAGLNLAVVRSIGMVSMAIIIVCILLALGAAYAVGTALGLPRKTSVLLGAGTAICGSSAIVAIAPLIKADSKDLVLSVSTVYLTGVAFMLTMPAIGTALGMSPEAFGVWVGTSIHAVPQAVTAGFAIADAGEVATLVKLVRVAMLAPLALLIALLAANGRGEIRSIRIMQLVPWFIWGFVGMAIVSTIVRMPDVLDEETMADAANVLAWINRAGTVLLTLSMAAIGLEVDLREMARVGSRALLACAVASVILAAGSYVMISLVL